jgi:hypothetical protein
MEVTAMRRDEAVHRLVELGRTEVTSVDPAFADRLDARLRVMVVAETSRRPSRWPRFAVATVVVVAAVFAVLALASRSGGVPTATVAFATNASVEFPDGSVADDPEGLELPDGSVIRVAMDGSAVVAGVTLGPGDTAVVRDGRVDVDPRGTLGGTDEPVADEPVTDGPVTDAPPGSTPVVTREPTPAATREPVRDRSPVDEPTAAPTRDAVADQPGPDPDPDLDPPPTDGTRPSDAPATGDRGTG